MADRTRERMIARWAASEMPKNRDQAMKNLIRRSTMQYAIEAQSQTMNDFDYESFAKWFRSAPNADPRMYAPLMLAGLTPDDPTSQDVVKADIAARIADGTYAATVDGRGDGVSSAPGPANVPRPDDYQTEPEQSWWQTALDNVVPDPNNEFWDNLMPDPTTTIGSGVGTMLQGPQFVSRNVLAAAQTPIDFLTSGFRSAYGDQNKISNLVARYGLTDEERSLALNYDAVWGNDKSWDEIASMNIPGITSFNDLPDDQKARIKAFLDDYRTVGTNPVGGVPGEESTGDARARMLAGESLGEQIMKQTAGGQAFSSVEKYKALIADDSGSWLPSPEIERLKEVESVKAFDIRTAEEIADGVEPLGWTPGRGLAHVWLSADDSAFYTWSGVVDFGVSITADPVNYIPMGAVGKVARSAEAGVALATKGRVGANALLRSAVDGGGEKVIVNADTFASQGAAASRRGAASTAAAKGAGAKTVADPVFQNRNVTITDDGRVLLNSGPRAGMPAPHSKFLSNDRAWMWLNSGKGMAVVKDLAGRESAFDIWKRSGGERGGMDWALAQQLADAKTEPAVRAVLGSRIGVELDDAGQLLGFGQSPVRMKFGQAVRSVPGAEGVTRALAVAGRGRMISLHDDNTLVTELDAYATAAKMSHEARAEAIDAVFKAATPAEKYEAIFTKFLNGATKDSLVARGVDPLDAEKVVKAYTGSLDQAQRELWNRGVAFGGGPKTGSPTLMSESLADMIALPGYREILRTASSTRKIRRAFGEKANEHLADFFQNVTSVWRNLVLLRPAYTLREVGEMSFSMALSGYDSLFTHPVQAIAMVQHVAALNASRTASGNLLKAFATGAPDDAVRSALRREVAQAKNDIHGGGVVSGSTKLAYRYAQRGIYETSTAVGKAADFVLLGRGVRSLMPFMDSNIARVTGEDMFAELQRYIETGDRKHLTAIADAMAVTHGNFLQDEVAKHFGRSVQAVRRPDIANGEQAGRYARGIADRLRKGSEDPDVRNIAKTHSDPDYTIQDVIDDYVNGTKAEKHRMFLNSKGMEEWATTKTDDEFIQANEDVLRSLTGSDPELIEAVHTGKYKGKDIGPDNKEFVDKVEEVVLANPKDFPEEVGVMVFDRALQRKWDEITTNFFENTSAFSDVFARGPLVRQAYVRKVEQLGEHMSPAAKAEVVANLRQAGDIKLARKVQAIRATGGLGVDEVDAIAAGFARNEMRRIFYDAGKRQNWAVAMRVVSPFAQATMNTFKRWALMSVQNPQSYYRALKPLMALQQPGSAVIYDVLAGMTGDPELDKYYEPGRPSVSANGYFYTDRYGERKFAYPLVGPLAKLFGVIGVNPVGEGSMENLNVAGTTFNPGFGPAITLAASFGLADDISEDNWKGDVLRFAFPYGLAGADEGIMTRIGEAILPTAGRKISAALDANNPQRMQTAVAVLSSLADSGNYDLTSQVDYNRMLADADALAQRMMVWSALLGSATPSTFQPDMFTEVKGEAQGEIANFLLTDKLMEEYQKYTKDDYQEGTFNFVRDFGETALLSALPRTTTSNIAQATNDMWTFRTDHPDSYRQNIEVIGLFMSNDDLGSNFARELFTEQRQSGVRGYLPLTGANSYSEKVNEALGWMLYNRGTQLIDDKYGDDEKSKIGARAMLRQDLANRYPGFSVGAKDTGKTTELIAKVRDALGDEGVQTLPSYYYIDRYMRQRDAALKAVMENGGSDRLDTKANASISAALWDLGVQYANDDLSGGFRHIWNRLFSQELTNPTIEEEEG